MKPLLFIFVLLISTSAIENCEGQWSQCNGIYTGTVYSFTSNSNYLFAGGEGVFSSTNSGITWVQTSLSNLYP